MATKTVAAKKATKTVEAKISTGGIDLNKFKKCVEKRLPILFLVEESGTRVPAQFVQNVMKQCVEKNILAEVAVISYGLDWTFRYPVLKGSSPYFMPNEMADFSTVYLNAGRSNQALLGAALKLSKAILDDTETVKPDRYKPVVMIVSDRTPAKGWEEPFGTLLNEGRSSKAQFYWLVTRKDLLSEVEEKILKKTTETLVSECLAEGSLDFDIDEKSGSKKSLKKNKKVHYVSVADNIGFNGVQIDKVEKIVNSFKLEPLDDSPVEEPPAVEPEYFDDTGIEEPFGDGTAAKGNGFV